MKAVELCRQRQELEQECGKILVQLTANFADLGLWERARQVAESIRFERLRQRALCEISNRRRGYHARGVPE
jgi:hypothetical protein